MVMSKKKKINRRQFVKKASTAVASAGVIAAGSGTGISLLSNSASAQVMMSGRIS
ncbi:MAG: hypothetical protein CM1200mP30_16890 [Pseudomonadota bacterium]|nr:MAG: hypothetical protein CM1200mP30_16890 [Pseudomonadota bacterium]